MVACAVAAPLRVEVPSSEPPGHSNVRERRHTPFVTPADRASHPGGEGGGPVSASLDSLLSGNDKLPDEIRFDLDGEAKEESPLPSTGRPALPLLPEGSAQRTVRKGDPPAGDQVLRPCGRRGERPGVLVAGGSHGWRSEQSCGGLRLYCYHSSGPPGRSQAASRLKKVLRPVHETVAGGQREPRTAASARIACRGRFADPRSCGTGRL